MSNTLNDDSPVAAHDIINEPTLRARLPVSRRSLKNWRDEGSLPFIRLPGSRLIWYHWPSVQAALLRQQKGGVL